MFVDPHIANPDVSGDTVRRVCPGALDIRRIMVNSYAPFVILSTAKDLDGERAELCVWGPDLSASPQDDRVSTPQRLSRMRMRCNCGQPGYRSGFSLGEMLAAVIIGAMMLTAILSIYGRANRAAEAVLSKVDSPSLASEVLQLIAEDLGRTLGADDMIVQIRNGFDNGFVRAELVLRRTFHDRENQEQTLEEIIWRAGYDRGGPTPGLVIYRSYNGVGQEDKLLDDQRDIWEKNYPFVPICRGVTFFQFQACKGDDLVDQWPPSAPPPGIKVTISFAESYETVRGTRDVRDDLKISRTIAIDPTRKVKFALDLAADPNAVDDPNVQSPDGQTPDNQAASERVMNQQSPGTRAPNAQTATRTRQR